MCVCVCVCVIRGGLGDLDQQRERKANEQSVWCPDDRPIVLAEPHIIWLEPSSEEPSRSVPATIESSEPGLADDKHRRPVHSHVQL